ncbi:MAG: DUF2059 domain-containing protein [Aquabacterium sp.]
MKLTHTAWASALVAALALSSMSAHADKKEWTQKIVGMQQDAVDGMARAIAEQPARQMQMQSAQIIAHAIPTEKRDATAKQVETELKKYVDSATPLLKSSATKLSQTTIGAGLEEKFSEDELKQLYGMLDSPVMKKFQAAIPELSKQLQEKVMAEAQKQLAPKVDATGNNVKKILDTASGGKLSAALAESQKQQQQQAPAAGTKK